jgi:phage repressor protein C with HTH and peptisase S24 domain
VVSSLFDLMLENPDTVRTSTVFGKVKAVRIEGNSMWPRYSDGDILAFKKEVGFLEDATDKECIVRLADNGEHLLKIVRKGSEKGTVHLESHNAPFMHNVKIAWAAPLIDWIKRA